MRSPRCVVLSVVAYLFSALIFQSVATAADSSPQKRDGVWAQTYSDLKPEADIRFGTLANGMRYAIMHNATPPGQTSLRLFIGAGSLQEREDQRGLAHFLEHMAFKGSTHVPQDEMVRILQRKGLAFGPDTNAFTSYDETVFKLDLPQSDADRLDTGLLLLREIGGELLLTQSAMDSERGVVLSEERFRESPARELAKSTQAFQFEGQLAARRDPIGLTEVIRTAPVSLIRDYYQANYRPENATLVAVGDFDVDAMEAKIKARFADWRGKGTPGAAPVLGTPERRGPTVHIFVRDGVPQVSALSWVQPYDNAADTLAQERRRLVEGLGLAVLNRRLARIAQAPNPPFIGASVSRNNSVRSARFTNLFMIASPEQRSGGMAATIAEQRRACQYGVTQAELQETLSNLRAAATALVASSSTRWTGRLADALVADVDNNEVFTGPRQNLAHFEEYVKDLNLKEVNGALCAAFAGWGPLINVASPKPVDGGEAGVRAAYNMAIAQPVANAVAAIVKPWPYDSFGPPGKVVWRREIADLGLTQVRFANGVRLNVKSTTFSKDQILITAKIGEGLLGQPINQSVPTWLVGALGTGGTKELTIDEINQSSPGVIGSVGFSMGEDALVFSGATRPQDFSKELQLMTAMISRPGYRPEAVQSLKASFGVALPMMDSTPGGVGSRELPQLLHSGDARWRGLPTAAELAAATPSELPALVGPALKSGAMEVTVVGDVTVDQVIATAGATLATLPSREDPQAVPIASRTIRPPGGRSQPMVLLHKGRSDQAIAFVEWPTTDFYADPHGARVRDVAIHILQNRLIDRVRSAEGATYSPSAGGAAATDLVGYGFVDASVEIPPGKIDGFYNDVASIVRDMGRSPPSADELLRAKAPMLEAELKARETNGFWLGTIASSQADPRVLDNARSRIADLRSVTADEVMLVCRKYLTQDRAWKLIVRAVDSPPLSEAQPTR
jgi:zinc protease